MDPPNEQQCVESCTNMKKKTNSLINGVSVLNNGGGCMCLKQVVDVQQESSRKTCLLEPKRPSKWRSCTRFFKARSAFSKQLCLSSSVLCASVCHTFYLYGKSLPLFLSDIFSQIFSKCRIFPDMVSERDIFIFSYLCF